MYSEGKIWIGANKDGERVVLHPSMANRHGLIAGATGTGKTVTLKVLAESFSSAGVPVFLADIKGDIAGTCKIGTENDKVSQRANVVGATAAGFSFQKYPVNFWDVYGEKGMPLRTTISEMGPLLLSKIMGLTDVQSNLLTVIFKIADDNGLLLIDTKDLKALLTYVGDNAADFTSEYGNIAKQSIGAIIRSVVAMEAEGAETFFGEPALNINDWLQRDPDGKGMIQILDCQKLVTNPTMYSTFMLWMMSELFENLPEVGDLDRPKMVFFFDEAHLLFNDASKILLSKIEQMVKLIRSKGVGIYFITQSPKDIPDSVLAQLGNKIQHALHAYTPAEQKNAKAVAMSYRANDAFDTYDTLLNLATGEALISVLDPDGVPTVVDIATILPPQSMMGPIDDETREQEVKGNLLYSRYSDFFDRDSAYEFLQRKNLADAEAAQEAADEAARQKEEEKAAKAAAAKTKSANKLVGNVAKTTGSTVGREIGKALGSTMGGRLGKTLGGNIGASLGRGILGSLFGK